MITVGRQLGLLLYNLVALGKVEAKNIHLIGHSLGAQVAHHANGFVISAKVIHIHSAGNLVESVDLTQLLLSFRDIQVLTS